MPGLPGRRLRVLYYVESLDIGGANQSTVTTALAMRRRGHEVYFASLDGPLRDRLASAGIPHVPVETHVTHPSLRAARRLGEVIDREGIDVVCPNGWDCLMDVLLATIPRGTAVVPTFGGMLNPEYAHPRTPRAIVFSGEYREELIRHFGWNPASLALHINRIDTDRFRPGLDASALRRRWGLEEGTPVVLMACRLDSLKLGGVRFLLDAVEDLGRRVPSVRVLLVGDGEGASEVGARAAEINRRAECDRVLLTGKIFEMEMAFSAADVVVGNGARSALEGLASGRPVVSVGDSGLAGVFTPENIEHFAYYNFDKGRVYDGTTRRDSGALAETLASLLLDEPGRRRLGQFGREYCVRSAGVEAGMARLEEILLQARRRSPAQRVRDAWEFARSLSSFVWCAARRRLRRLLFGIPTPLASPPPRAGGKSFLKDSARTFLTQLFGIGVGMVQAAVVARILLPEGKGTLAVALLLPQLIATFAPLGINWASIYHLGRGTYDRETLTRAVLGALLLLGGAGMFVCLGTGFWMKDSLLRGVPPAAFFLGVLTVPTQIGLLCLSALFRGEMRIVESNRMDVSRTALMFLGILLGLLALRMGVTGVIFAQLLAEALVILVAFRRFGGVAPRPLFRWDILRNLMGYGLQVYSFAVLLYLNFRFDLFLVGSMLDRKQTGLYATAVGLAELLWMVPTSLGTVLFPSIARSNPVDRDRLTLTVLRHTFWLMLILCGVLALGRNLALQIFFGKQFLPAASALLAILPGIFAMSLQLVVGSDLSGRGHPLPVTLGAALGFAVNLALNLAWIPRLGIVGASLASSVSYAVVAAVVVVAFFRISGSSLRDAFLLRREDWGRLTRLLGRAKEVAA